MTPMISPDGDIGDIPAENVADAVKAGYKVGQDMLSPDGHFGTIPLDKVHDALKSGFMLKGAAPGAPKAPAMQKSNLAESVGGGSSSSSAVANPQQPGEQFALDNPDQQGKLAGAAAVGAGGTALTEAMPALYQLGLKHMAGDVLPGMEEEAAKAKLLQYAPKVLHIVKDLGISGGGLGLLWKAILGGKEKQH